MLCWEFTGPSRAAGHQQQQLHPLYTLLSFTHRNSHRLLDFKLTTATARIRQIILLRPSN